MTTPHVPILLLFSRNPQLIYLMQRYAENCSCQLLVNQDVTTVITTIGQQPPNLILLDVSQANADGHEALRKIKENTAPPFIPIILCGTSEMDWLNCEAEGHLLQPILFNDFAHAVSEVGIPISQNTKEV